MKKIPSLFKRGSDDRLCINEINPECQWVMQGEGKPTAKLDGTSCCVVDGKLYKRYDNSKRKGDIRIQTTTPLPEWIHCECPTEHGKYIYWIPIGEKDYHHLIAWGWAQGKLEDGTYELVGPGVQGNIHGYEHCTLIRHGIIEIDANPRTFDEIKEFMTHTQWEGIVWHNSDGRMCKIVKSKFGII